MKDDELEPLSPLASRLLASERARTPAVDAGQAALLGRVLGTVGATTAIASTAAAKAAAGANAGAGAGVGAAGAKAAGAGAAAASGGALAGAISTKVAVAGAISTKVAVVAAALAFGAGVGVGVVGRGVVAPKSTDESSSAVDPRLATTASSTAPQRTADTELPPDDRASESPPSGIDANERERAPSSHQHEAPQPPVAPRRESSPIVDADPRRVPSERGDGGDQALARAESDADLAGERALVDRARAALARGDAAACLEAVRSHEARFPNGRLAEEREVLAVRALARAGQTDEARARADRFRKRYPNSVFAGAIESITRE